MMINDANLTQLITFLEYYYASGAAECIMQCVYCNSQILGISTLHFKTVPCSVKQKTRKRSTRPAMWGTASSAAGISPIPAIMNITAPPSPGCVTMCQCRTWSPGIPGDWGPCCLACPLQSVCWDQSCGLMSP